MSIEDVRNVLRKLGANAPPLEPAAENVLSQVKPVFNRNGKLIQDAADEQLDLFIVLWIVSDKRVRPLIEDLFEMIYHDSFEHRVMHRFDNRNRRSE